MKTLSTEQILELSKELKKLELKKQISTVLEYYAKEFTPGDVWTGIYIEKTEQLQEFQKVVLEISKKYQDQSRNKHTYAIDDFYEEQEIAFYKEEEYLARPELHITLGKQDKTEEYKEMKIHKEIMFDKLVIGKIGNYGSVREVLFEINLK